jgi:3-hydroxybutyryl-CoA dehydratase
MFQEAAQADMSGHGFKPGDVIKGPSKTLTDAHFLFFAGLTGDSHPIHYDVEYARRMGFAKPLAHGLLMAAMTALGASPVSPQLDGFVFVEQGSQFIRPAVVGDTIQPQLVVERVWNEGKREYVRFATSIRNQRDETLLEGFHVYTVRPRKEEHP